MAVSKGPFVLLAGAMALVFYLSEQRNSFAYTHINSMKVMFAYGLLHSFFYLIDLHGRWGILGVSEPKSHYFFSMKSLWIVYLWALGSIILYTLLGIVSGQPHFKDPNDPYSYITWSFPEEYQIIVQSVVSEIFWSLVIFYAIDFMRYWTHRCGHWSFFYKTWPFSHAHHHNQTFLNPLVTVMHPFIHPSFFGTAIPLVIGWALGLRRPAVWASLMSYQVNFTQHLGFDPFPWLTKLNHSYFYGALPWIPLYHQYHHLPFVKKGNYGNVTCLFDYVYGTLIQESVQHIETGQPPKWILERMNNPKQLEKFFERKLSSKNRLDLNVKYDSSIFSFHYV